MRKPRSIRPFGKGAILLEWEQSVDPDIHRGVTAYARTLERLAGVTECVPAYASLLVCIDGPLSTWMDRLYDLAVPEVDESGGRLHRIPVCYGGEFGPDLENVARASRLTEAEVIEAHAGRNYRVYLLGYRPGFPFLGKVDSRIRAPRHSAPRPRVPAGSVGLAGEQTGIYPVVSPGGWQLIGNCGLRLINDQGSTRFRTGDEVCFFPVSPERMKELEAADEWEAC